MWSEGGGGGFNTSFGGDEGAGYGTQQFASPGPEVKRNRRIESVLPVTIRTILDLDVNAQEYLGAQVNMVTVVGLIRSVDISVTKVTYLLDDTTSTMQVIKWIDAENEDDKPLMEYTYCRVYGTYKSHMDNKQLLALQIEQINNFNWITSHIVEVIHTTLQLNRLKTEAVNGGIGKSGATMGGGSGTMSNSMVGFGGLSDPSLSGGDMALYSGTNLTQPQKMVLEVIRSASNDCEDSGYSRDYIKGKLKGKQTTQQVDNVLFFLSSEGHIYTTEDEDHFKVTDG